MSPQFDSSFGILTHNGKLLLVLRDTKEKKPLLSDPDTWCFIGGGAEESETPRETYVREVKEEIDIDLHDTEFLCEFSLADQLKYVFFNELTDEDVAKMRLGNEGQRLAFFSFDELHQLPLAKTTKAFIGKEQVLLRKLLTT